MLAQASQQGMSFAAYFELFEKLVQAKKTTGENQSEALVTQTKLNFLSTKRILKTTVIPEALSNTIGRLGSYNWIVISEPWCSDSANALPVIAQLAALNSNITLRILLRDEHSDLMDAYLTNGNRAVPKLICANEAFEEIGSWGPRPLALQDYVDQLKADPYVTDLKKHIQLWYIEDKGRSVMASLHEAILQWEKRCKNALVV